MLHLIYSKLKSKGANFVRIQLGSDVTIRLNQSINRAISSRFFSKTFPGGVNACDVWISYWVGGSNASSNRTEDTKFFLTVYGGIAGSAALFSVVWPLALFFGFLTASRILHRLLLDVVLKAKMQFFDSTPSGRILNRFSKDINSSDDTLPLMALIFLAETLGVIGTLSVVIYSMPWFAAIVAPISAVYYVIQSYYRHAAR